MKSETQANYIFSREPEPHIGRRKQMLAAHPEIKKLFGVNPWSALWIVAIVALQVVAAVSLSHSSFWLMLLVAYTLGAVCDHAMFVMIHDSAHNLVFKAPWANRWISILANFPIVFPSAIAFRKFHLIHHRYQGNMEYDADLAGPIEAKIMGRNAFTKALWLLFFFVFEGVVRPARLKGIKWVDGWTICNTIVQLTFLTTLVVFAGWGALLYLFLSSCFSIGLHPLGARWIQEHYVVKEGQETFSYYGPANAIMFNVGYHNEHHDFMTVPWSRLPALRAAAPEFYDTLYSHQSYIALLLKFIFDPKLNLYSRVIRTNVGDEAEEKRPAMAAPINPSSIPAT